jgi:TM2 domain-containing membrane protein YozV
MSDPNQFPPTPPAGSGQPTQPPAPGYAAQPPYPTQPTDGTPGTYPSAPAYAAPGYPAPPAYAPQGPSDDDPDVGTKSFVVTWLLAMLLGTFGVDRFYLGKIGTAIVKLITLGGFGVWSLIDLIIVLCGGARDKQGLRLAGYVRYRLMAWLVTVGVWVLGIISSIVSTIVFGSFLFFGATAALTGAAIDSVDEYPTAVEEPEDGSDVAAPGGIEDELDDLLEDLPGDVADLSDDDVTVSEDKDAALEDARMYVGGNFSKQATYDLLTNEYIDHYTDDAAQYAMDNLGDVDWNANALATAQAFVDYAYMSEQSTYEMLTNELGSAFTTDEADYAMENVEADWNANALQTAQMYLDELDLSEDEIRDMLTDSMGGQFTDEQADYAMENLQK